MVTLNVDFFSFSPSSEISFPFNLHQAIKAKLNETVVTEADTKNVEPIHNVSPIPGTADVAFQIDA